MEKKTMINYLEGNGSICSTCFLNSIHTYSNRYSSLFGRKRKSPIAKTELALINSWMLSYFKIQDLLHKQKQFAWVNVMSLS